VKNARMPASPVDNLPLKLNQPAAKHAALTRDSRKGDKPPSTNTIPLSFAVMSSALNSETPSCLHTGSNFPVLESRAVFGLHSNPIAKLPPTVLCGKQSLSGERTVGLFTLRFKRTSLNPLSKSNLSLLWIWESGIWQLSVAVRVSSPNFWARKSGEFGDTMPGHPLFQLIVRVEINEEKLI